MAALFHYFVTVGGHLSAFPLVKRFMMKARTILSIVTIPLFYGVGDVEGAVVMNQIGNAAAYDFTAGSLPSPSQIFTDFANFDCAVLEDFTVDSSELGIGQVSGLFKAEGGFASFQDVDGFELNIFSDVNLAATSLTGNIASLVLVAGSGASVVQVIDSSGNGEYGLVNLNVNILLPSAGTYWLAISPKSLNATGQFLIPNGGASGDVTPGNANAMFANPGLGFGLGALSPLNLDYAYSVTAVPEPGSVGLWFSAGLGLCVRRRRGGRPSHRS